MNVMNKLFKKLADEAFFDEASSILPSDIMYKFSDHKMQKFAELIVRECTDVLRQESERLYKLASEEEDEVFAGNFEICAEKCVDNEIAIKDHFGMKE